MRLYHLNYKLGHYGVSIHAPTWGATRYGSKSESNQCKFQSTHPHGVRPDHSFEGLTAGQFQSTHPHGVRRKVAAPTLTGKPVSIHAPTWGATKKGWQRDSFGEFQSTHPHGVRLFPSLIIIVTI